MGKTLRELLDTFPFDPRFNPNKQTDDMIKPDPSDRFAINIEQSKDWLKATPKLYGADIIRIMSQGQVDTKKIKKAAVKVASKVVSKIPIVGGVAGGAISQLTNPKLPGDLYTGLSESEPDQMVNSLYTDLLYGRIRNDKGALGNFLKDNASLKNLGANLKNALVSAAIGGATKLVSAGLDALINKKKLTLKKKKLPAVKPPFGQLYPDNFPSTFAFQSGVTDNIAINQTQFSNRPGLFGGLFGAGMELGKEEGKIKVIKLSNTPTQDGLVKGTSNRLDDFYIKKYLEVNTKLNGYVPVISLHNAKDDKSANPFTYQTQNGLDYSAYLGNDTTYYTFDSSIVSQNYGTGDNILKNRWETKDGTIRYNNNIIASHSFDNTTIYRKSFNDLNSTVNADGIRDFDTGSLKISNDVYYTSINFAGGDNLLDDPGTGLKGAINSTSRTINYKGNAIARQRFNSDNTFEQDAFYGKDFYKDINTRSKEYYSGQEKYVPYPKRKLNVLQNTDGKVFDIVDLAIGKVSLLGTITGLSDNATPSWTDAKSVGSGFKFYLYDTWEREISFKFQMYADNNQELDLIWKKAEAIKKLTLPTPKGNIGVFGELIRLKIGNIINTPYGFLTACNLTVSDDSPWEITKKKQKPFIFEMDITYKVVSNTDNTTYTFYS
jgi:hypothetical protein